jgi:hypothetical protein
VHKLALLCAFLVKARTWMALSLLLLHISVTFILPVLYATTHQTTHCSTSQRPSIIRWIQFVKKTHNFDSTQMTEIKTSKNFSPGNLLQLGLVQLRHISTQSQICNTQYMLLSHADDLLCLQLHTVQYPHTVHDSNQCWQLAVPTAAHSMVLIFITFFKVFVWLHHINGVILRGHPFYIVRLKLCL